jgi:hypothetical protein
VYVIVAFLGICVVHSRIAHRANYLASRDGIANLDVLRSSMQDFVKKAVFVPNRYSSNRALPGILHDAIYG